MRSPRSPHAWSSFVDDTENTIVSIQKLGEGIDNSDLVGGWSANGSFHQALEISEVAIDADTPDFVLPNFIGDEVADVVLIACCINAVREFTLIEVNPASFTFPYGDISKCVLCRKTKNGDIIPEDVQSREALVILGLSEIITLPWGRTLALPELRMVSAPKP